MSALTRVMLGIGVVVVGSFGCEQRLAQKNSRAASSAIDAGVILDRCVTAFAGLRTLRIRATLRDDRYDERKIVPIEWELARPDRCRVRIDQQTACVVGDDWWSRDSAEMEFRKQKSFSRTPMETAAYVMTKGISFPEPALFERGEAALGKSGVRGYTDWALKGVAWSSGRPCYVLGRSGQGPDRKGLFRLWIDQDSYVLRGWDLLAPESDGAERTILSCTYHEVRENAPIAAERFAPTTSAPSSAGAPLIDGADRP